MVMRLLIVLIVISTITTGVARGSVDPKVSKPSVKHSSTLPGKFFKAPSYATLFGRIDRLLPGRSSADKQARQFVGKLISPNGTKCTASLVGEDLVLTAAHCVANESYTDLARGTYAFHLGYDNGRSSATSEVSYIWWGELKGNLSKDWALVKLKKPLGKDGYFGVRVLSASNFTDYNLNISGYSKQFYNGERLTIAKNCRFQSSDQNMQLLYNDCDITEGDSGAPVYVCDGSSCYIVAIHVAANQDGQKVAPHIDQYSHKWSNISNSAAAFKSEIERRR